MKRLRKKLSTETADPGLEKAYLLGESFEFHEKARRVTVKLQQVLNPGDSAFEYGKKIR